jgi:ApaG protein
VKVFKSAWIPAPPLLSDPAMVSTIVTTGEVASEVSLCREVRIIYLRGVAGEPIRELPGLWVSLDRVEYNPHEEGTPDRPYGFVYHITIHNDSPRVVTIKGRKWVVTNADNSKLVIEGDGVVGECPRLTPGTQFHYQSYHLIASNSVAEGAYLGQVENGERVFTRIPQFKMEVPPL